MSDTRKLAAILAFDVVGYSRLAGADEDRILARLRALPQRRPNYRRASRSSRQANRRWSIVEFRSFVDAARCPIEVLTAMVERNAGVPEDRRIVFRIGIHIGDVVEESDGDLMGDASLLNLKLGRCPIDEETIQGRFPHDKLAPYAPTLGGKYGQCNQIRKV
jgi:adenylate cyclase